MVNRESNNHGAETEWQTYKIPRFEIDWKIEIIFYWNIQEALSQIDK